MQVLLFMYDLLAEAAEHELPTNEEPASSALIELEKVLKSAEWCERFATTFVKMVRRSLVALVMKCSCLYTIFYIQAPVLSRRKVIELVDAMRLQLPTCENVFKTSGVKSVVEKVAQEYADDQELDEAEKEELVLFFQDFLDRV